MHILLRLARRGARAAVTAAALALAFAASAHAQAPDHSPWDRLLERYVVPGGDGVTRVNYAAWRASPTDRRALDAYVATLAAARPSAMGRDDAFAYWANLYNALTVDVILDNYPVDSIRDIRSRGSLSFSALIGPWKTELVTVEGERLSLDDIEHGIMRPTFADPRVHYAVNCASIGCPNLQRQAFRGERLNAQLDAAARAYVNHPRGVRVTDRGLRLSRIYQWFREDFGDEAGLRAHLAQYAGPERVEAVRTLRIAGYEYDWALNDASATRR